MSDPIAAAEAAGKARDIANRFETAVFLIAYGIAEKVEEYIWDWELTGRR